MPLHNNNFAREPDAEHSERAHKMAVGIVKYGEAIGFTAPEIADVAGYAALFDAAYSAWVEERADVDEIYVEMLATDKSVREQYVRCQDAVRGEMAHIDAGATEYLNERFDIEGRMPKNRAKMIAVAQYMLTGFDNIGQEHPEIHLPAQPFGLCGRLPCRACQNVFRNVGSRRPVSHRPLISSPA